MSEWGNGRPVCRQAGRDGRPYLTAVRRAGTHIVGATVPCPRQAGRSPVPHKSFKLMTLGATPPPAYI
ncbi:MAG: hypothetical protein FWG68_10510 [Defluviitaleaceae bacterium]|nr:hypothetical protein [Defluviitaleaceae bacterium]